MPKSKWHSKSYMQMHTYTFSCILKFISTITPRLTCQGAEIVTKSIAKGADSLCARGSSVQIQSISWRELALLNKLSSQQTNLGQFFDVLTPTFPLLRCRWMYRKKVREKGGSEDAQFFLGGSEGSSKILMKSPGLIPHEDVVRPLI